MQKRPILTKNHFKITPSERKLGQIQTNLSGMVSGWCGFQNHSFTIVFKKTHLVNVSANLRV
jgi:hypothetical protein